MVLILMHGPARQTSSISAEPARAGANTSGRQGRPIQSWPWPWPGVVFPRFKGLRLLCLLDLSGPTPVSAFFL